MPQSGPTRERKTLEKLLRARNLGKDPGPDLQIYSSRAPTCSLDGPGHNVKFKCLTTLNFCKWWDFPTGPPDWGLQSWFSSLKIRFNNLFSMVMPQSKIELEWNFLNKNYYFIGIIKIFLLNQIHLQKARCINIHFYLYSYKLIKNILNFYTNTYFMKRLWRQWPESKVVSVKWNNII